ncbi:MAG TPA: hypothetical protein VF069_25590 [Streptosporangiaceae bacterium]
MITLKAVLVGSSCAGVLAVGGGITYATVGDSHATHPSHVTAPGAGPALAAPDHARPACLPKAGGASHALPKAGDVRQAVPQQAPAMPNAADAQRAAAQAGQQAQAQLRQAQQQAQQAQGGAAPAAGLPKVDGAQVPASNAPAPGVPGTNCLPSVPAKAPKPSVPATPALPKVPNVPTKVSCDSVKPAVVLGGPVERKVILSHGLGHGTKHVRVIVRKAHKLCVVTERWVGSAGQWLQVERLQVPQPYGLDQLRDALRLPAAGGVPVSVSGQRGWMTPLGGAVLWYSEDGFAMCVTGSPAYATQLQSVAAQLQQAAQQG